jgi:ABC-type sulfate/molybdate transport systems ATPase subunit
VLLLDEPFGALDALTRARLQDELMKIVQAAGSTVVMVTHDVDDAVLPRDRIVMMTNGTRGHDWRSLRSTCRVRAIASSSTRTAQYHHYRTAVLEFLYRRQAHVEAAAVSGVSGEARRAASNRESTLDVDRGKWTLHSRCNEAPRHERTPFAHPPAPRRRPAPDGPACAPSRSS